MNATRSPELPTVVRQQHGRRRVWHAARSQKMHVMCRHLVQAPALQSDAAVTANGVYLSFGRDAGPVLRGLDLQVQRGSLHMLLGPNGCGKSTLLRVLGGLATVDSGEVVTDTPTGFVFQNPDHQVVMPTVAADVAFGLGRYDLPEEDVQAAVESALDLVNMRDAMSRATHTLSGGQRQRVAIAGALAENPRLLLLDELTTFLDVEDQFGVLEAVRAVTRHGGVMSVASGRPPTTPATPKLRSPPAAASTDNGAAVQHGSSEPGARGAGQQQQQQQQQPSQRVTAIWVTHRFEELTYADAASYMQDGKVVFTGTGQEMAAYLRRLGAPV